MCVCRIYTIVWYTFGVLTLRMWMIRDVSIVCVCVLLVFLFRRRVSESAGRAVEDLRLNLTRCDFVFSAANTDCGSCGAHQMCHPEFGRCVDFCPEGRVQVGPHVPRPEDVWIVSYPKSGSTWLRHMIWNMHEYGRADRPATFDEVDAGIPFLEDFHVGNMSALFERQSFPRIFKSHHPYSCDVPPCRGWVVGGMQSGQCACPNCASRFQRVIYVVRDGRAAMYSYWRFRRELRLSKPWSFSRFLRWGGRLYPGVSWSDHVRSWMSARPGVDILWVRYEDMLSDPRGVLTRVSAFLGWGSAAAVDWAVSASSRESMYRTESETGPGFFARRYTRVDKGFRMVHRSDVGWRDRYTAADLAHFAGEQGYMLKCLGYESYGTP